MSNTFKPGDRVQVKQGRVYKDYIEYDKIYIVNSITKGLVFLEGIYCKHNSKKLKDLVHDRFELAPVLLNIDTGDFETVQNKIEQNKPNILQITRDFLGNRSIWS